MAQWIDGNIPDDKDAYYWITVNNGNATDVLPQPFQYNNEIEAWISFNGEKWSIHAVVAYHRISKPKKRATVGNGVGYYIRTYYQNGKEMIYGKGLQPANWCMTGYSDSEKAKTAARRLKKLDISDGTERDKYEIIDGESNLINEL